METSEHFAKTTIVKEPINKDSFKENNNILQKKLNNKLSNTNFYPLLSNISIYNIVFQNLTNNANNKMVIFNKSIQKILKLADFEENDIFSFILFYHNEINLEAIGENKSLYNINYNHLMNIINYVHIRYKDEDIKILKSSLKKIIDLCGLIHNEKFKYMNFQGIEDKKEENSENNNINLLRKHSSSSNNNEENNKIIRPKKIIKNRKNKDSQIMNNHKGKVNKLILNNELNDSNNDMLENNRYNKSNKNYLLDSDEEDYENKLLDRSYNILRSKKGNNIIKLNNIYNDTKDDTYFNTLDTINNENTLSTSLNDYINTNTKIPKMKTKEKIKKIIKKKKKIKKFNTQTLFSISSTSSLSYLGSTTSIQKLNKEVEGDSELIYPYNGYTQLTASFSIDTQNKPKEALIHNTYEDYCFFPFILRTTPELEKKVVYLSGSIPKLGVWDPLRAVKMNLEERNGEKFFTKYIGIYKDEIPFEYKYFYYESEKIKWLGDPFQNYITFPQFFDYLRSIKKSHISIININIRYINNIDGINIWENRKNKLIELLLNKTADIFFFQEITKPQSKFINKYLSAIYEFVGEYRDSSKASEKCSICVNKLKYTIIHSGQFWLSSNPYIPGSNDFGNFFPRTCTWASFKQIDGISLLFMNLHLDHANKRAHLPCIKVVLDEEEKIEAKYKDIKFVFIGGCFYCEENDEEINYIKKRGFNEIKFENTYHGFSGKAKNHWDYMFWKEKNGADIELKDVYVLKKEATIDKDKNYYVSDHYPVYVEFQHKNKK